MLRLMPPESAAKEQVGLPVLSSCMPVCPGPAMVQQGAYSCRKVLHQYLHAASVLRRGPCAAW